MQAGPEASPKTSASPNAKAAAMVRSLALDKPQVCDWAHSVASCGTLAMLAKQLT
jgi:hypothetical protein